MTNNNLLRSNRFVEWFFPSLPQARLAWFRVIVYLYIPWDLLVSTHWVLDHADAPQSLYHPLKIARILHLPQPTGTEIKVLFALLLMSGLAGVLCAWRGRVSGFLGWAIAVGYSLWMLVAMSYGKVDHDRFAYLVAIFALASVSWASRSENRSDPACGWVLRITQIAVIATYFLSSLAKLRYSGLDWLTGATLARSVIRRGTVLVEWSLHVPYLLTAFQWFIVFFEILSPVIFLLAARRQYFMALFFYGFHAMVFSAITIIFFPHLIALSAFLPLEKLSAPRELVGSFRRLFRRHSASRSASGEAMPVTGDEAVQRPG